MSYLIKRGRGGQDPMREARRNVVTPYFFLVSSTHTHHGQVSSFAKLRKDSDRLELAIEETSRLSETLRHGSQRPRCTAPDFSPALSLFGEIRYM